MCPGPAVPQFRNYNHNPDGGSAHIDPDGNLGVPPDTVLPSMVPFDRGRKTQTAAPAQLTRPSARLAAGASGRLLSSRERVGNRVVEAQRAAFLAGGLVCLRVERFPGLPFAFLVEHNQLREHCRGGSNGTA